MASRRGIALAIVLSLCFVVSVMAQNKDCGDCGLVKNDSFRTELSCEWRVADQTIDVTEPTVLVVPVEKSCPLLEKGILNLWQCEKCAELHKPCQGQYAACEGCCGTAWHSTMRVPSKHKCSDIQNYYMVANSKKVKCDKYVAPVGEVTISKLGSPENPDLAKGNLTDFCSTDILKVECKQIPVRLEFKCAQCNRGSPTLLKACCDKGVEWLLGSAVQRLRVQGFESFVWLSGCDVTKVKMPEGVEEFDFVHSHLYSNYTESTVSNNMKTWIENEICSLLDPICDEGTTTTTTTTATTAATALHPTHCSTEFILWTVPNDQVSAYSNQWSYWTASGGESSTGKTEFYDGLPVTNLRFKCLSPTNPWEVHYNMHSSYSGKTAREIADSCVGSARTNRVYVNSRRRYSRRRGYEAVGNMNSGGMCSTQVGSRSYNGCNGLSCGNYLRLGVGNGYAETHDWAFWSMGDSSSYPTSNWNGATIPHVGGEYKAGYCPSGRLSISTCMDGKTAATSTTSTTTLTTTTTSTIPCMDRFSRPGSGRRMQEETERLLQDETSCPWFDAEAQSHVYAEDNMRPDTSTHSPSTPKLENSWVDMVSSTLSGFNEVITHATFKDVEVASATGLSHALNIDASVCKVSMHMISDTCHIKVGIATLESYARDAHSQYNPERLGRAIHMALFAAGHRTVKVTIDEKYVETVRDVRDVRARCYNDTLTEDIDHDAVTEDTADDTVTEETATTTTMTLVTGETATTTTTTTLVTGETDNDTVAEDTTTTLVMMEDWDVDGGVMLSPALHVVILFLLHLWL